jgi:hypothetical protein
MGYNDDGVVRDVLGPTNTNWERAQYDSLTFPVFEAQGSMGRRQRG